MIRILLIQLIFCAITSVASAQKKPEFKYYHTIGGLDTSQQVIMNSNNFSEIKIIDGRYIDPGGKEKLDSLGLVKGIEKLYPSKKYTGIGVLDWEAQAYNDLYKLPAGDPKFKTAMADFQKMVRIARKVRPNIKWGIYGIPYVTYWTRDSAWKNNYKKIMPLLKNLDILMPSLYDYYEDGTPSTDNDAYFTANAQLALEAGNKAGKPVYVFIWQRYFDGNEKLGLQLIPEKQFSRHLDIILNARHGSTRTTGLIWFDGVKYYYNIKPNLPLMDAQSMRMNETPANKKNVEDSIIKKYAEIIIQRVKKRKS